jgi:hypothetical protein
VAVHEAAGVLREVPRELRRPPRGGRGDAGRRVDEFSTAGRVGYSYYSATSAQRSPRPVRTGGERGRAAVADVRPLRRCSGCGVRPGDRVPARAGRPGPAVRRARSTSLRVWCRPRPRVGASSLGFCTGSTTPRTGWAGPGRSRGRRRRPGRRRRSATCCGCSSALTGQPWERFDVPFDSAQGEDTTKGPAVWPFDCAQGVAKMAPLYLKRDDLPTTRPHWLVVARPFDSAQGRAGAGRGEVLRLQRPGRHAGQGRAARRVRPLAGRAVPRGHQDRAGAGPL